MGAFFFTLNGYFSFFIAFIDLGSRLGSILYMVLVSLLLYYLDCLTVRFRPHFHHFLRWSRGISIVPLYLYAVGSAHIHLIISQGIIYNLSSSLNIRKSFINLIMIDHLFYISPYFQNYKYLLCWFLRDWRGSNPRSPE